MDATIPTNAFASSSTPGRDDEAAFAHATEKLLHIGAVPVSHYLQEPALAPIQQAIPAPLPAPPAASALAESVNTRAVARLHQACQNTFGSTEALQYEFVEDPTNTGKRCRITITRPNGAVRTYSSPAAYQKKYDAKAHVSSLAIENGAIDFIISGEGKEPTETEQTPSSGQGAQPAETLMEMDESVKAIEQTCLEWTYGRIKPYWLLINEPKFGRTQGCAMRIRLGSRNSRVWSVNTIYGSAAEAKKACAEVALAEGVVDYIMSWSSSTTDTVVYEPGAEFPDSAIGLQQFFDALPKPFPEPISGKTAIDVNGPAWLNTTIQSARGGKFVPNFIWTVDPRLNFHGCLLRLERPGEVKSYLVDARFSKRAEAKAAVCLLAMSEGVGDYIRGVAKAIEEKLPAATRRHVTEVLIPILNAEYRKVHGPGIQPHIEYDMDLDACGATLVVDLGPSLTSQQARKYTVPTEYRNRNDARLAVIAHAVSEGVIEYLRFKGRPPPPGYIPNYAQAHENHFLNRKRKNWEGGGGEWSGPGGGGWQNKKPRFGGGEYGSYHGPQTQGGGEFGVGQQTGQYHKPTWNGPKKYPNQPWGRPGQYGDGAGPSRGPGQFPPRPRYSGPPYAGQTAQPAAPASHLAGGGSMQHPQPTPTPYNHPAAGTPPAQAQAPYYAAAPQPSYPGTPAQASPYAASTPAAGTYSAYYSQPQQPVASTAAPAQYPQQYQYGAAYTSYPGQPQVSGYQYASAAVQYQAVPQTAYYPPAGAPASAPTPGVPAAAAYYSATSSALPAHSPVPPGANATYPQQYQHVAQPPAQPTPPVPSAHVSPPPVQPVPPVPPVQPLPPAQALQPNPPVQPVQPIPPVQPVQRVLSTQPTQPAPPAEPAPPPPPPIQPPPPPPPRTASPSYSTSGPTKRHRSHSRTTSPAPYSRDRSAQNGKSKKNGKVTIAVETGPKTSVAALYDHCRAVGMPSPQFYHEIVKSEHAGEPEHKVWVIIGKMKFELPVKFSSLSQGQEKVAKKVLDQLRQTKPNKGTKS